MNHLINNKIENMDIVKKTIIVSIISTLMSQVYINPYNSTFRLGMGVAVLTFLLLIFEDLSISLVTFSTSVCVFLFRSLLEVFQNTNIDMTTIFLKHFPAAMFYISLGFILHQINIRRHRSQPILLIFFIAIADLISNIIEIVIREEYNKLLAEHILNSLLITAFSRAIIAFILYTGARFFNLLILKEQHQKRYRELLLFTANMKAEIFFLKKTMEDVEKAMEDCFSIYRHLKGIKENKLELEMDIDKLLDKSLSLSKDIHEIKKDNKRVVTGIERLIPKEGKNNIMELSAIFDILHDNTLRYIESIGKEIYIHFEYKDDIEVKEYYSLITVINNLINNSIDAIYGNGHIYIREYMMDDSIIFNVSDNGAGINEKDMEVIFEPGFSTKFNKKTGQMSTGIGLSHVKHIVEKYFDGKITVESKIGMGTNFYISIPPEKIAGEGE